MRALLLLLISLPLWLAGTLQAAAQTDTTARDTARGASQSPSLGRAPDSARAEGGSIASDQFVMTKSPTTAVLLSIIPGGGQVYNKQYWKVPLFAGVAGFFIYRVIYYHNLYSDKADEAARLGMSDPDYSFLKQQREFYRDNRDLNAAYFLGVEILGMIDAYVGAHLFDFDVDDDVSSRIYLDPFNNAVGFSLRW